MNELSRITTRMVPAALLPLLLTVGCQSYTQLPLDPDEILKTVKAERTVGNAEEALTFTDAARLMSSRNRDLKALRAEYVKLKAIADIPTPLPNPELEVGSAIGRRMGITPESKTQPFASLGFAIPLGPRLKREDGLNAVKAETARLMAVAKHRDLFLELRAAFAEHALSSRRVEQRKALGTLIRQGEETSERLERAGQISDLELSQGKILNRLENLKQIDDELAANAAARHLADLLGVSVSVLVKRDAEGLPDLPGELGTVAELEKTLIQNNTSLSALRMAFWESDAELKLELAKQYPDLNFGLGFEQEPGEEAQVFELGIGIELPVFDRNKQGIARAVAARKAAKEAYKAEVARLLSRLESGRRNYLLLHRKGMAMKDLLPLAAENQRDALKLTALGKFDFLRYLDVSRAYAELAMEYVEQQSAAWAALAELERIVGRPLVEFPEAEANELPKTELKRNSQ